MVSPQTLLAVFLSVAALVVEGGVVPRQSAETKIIGGYEIDIRNASWQVSVRNRDNHLCGGAIISDRWIVSAAHCHDRRDPKHFDVLVGSTSVMKRGWIYEVEQVLIKERTDTFNDMSLLKTSRPMEFGPNVTAVKLPQLGAKPPAPGTEVRATGWGRTKNGPSYSTMLQALDMKLHDSEYCKKFAGMLDSRTRVCAGDEGMSLCNGDSGGPLVAGDLLVGISSYHNGKYCAHKPTIFMDVTAFRGWIKTRTGV